MVLFVTRLCEIDVECHPHRPCRGMPPPSSLSSSMWHATPIVLMWHATPVVLVVLNMARHPRHPRRPHHGSLG